MENKQAYRIFTSTSSSIVFPPFLIQKKIVIILNNASNNDSFRELNILKLNDISKYFEHIKIFKIKYYCRASYLLNEINNLKIQHCHLLRFNNYRLSYIRIFKFKQCLIYPFMLLHNCIPDNLKSILLFKSFKRAIKNTISIYT